MQEELRLPAWYYYILHHWNKTEKRSWRKKNWITAIMLIASVFRPQPPSCTVRHKWCKSTWRERGIWVVKSKELAFDSNSHIKYAFAKGESFGKNKGKFYLLPTVCQHGNLSFLTFVCRVKAPLKHSRFVSTAILQRLTTACDELLSTSIVTDVW